VIALEILHPEVGLHNMVGYYRLLILIVAMFIMVYQTKSGLLCIRIRKSLVVDSDSDSGNQLTSILKEAAAV
jgi:hypothetical protein